MVNFPTSLDSFTNPGAGDTTAAVNHADQHANANDAIEAIEAKVGVGASTPSAGKVLRASGSGSSEWGAVESTDVDGATGTGDFVLAVSPAILSATLTTPIINNPTLNTDVISEFTTAAGVTIDGLLIKDGTIPDSLITPAKILAGTGSSWVWQSYTPSTSGLTIGNGTLAGEYCQIGKTVFFRLRFTLGSTSAVTGNVTCSLPVAGSTPGGSGKFSVGNVRFYDSSAGLMPAIGTVILTGASTATVTATRTSGTYADDVALSSTVPFTWATGDEFKIYGYYEAA